MSGIKLPVRAQLTDREAPHWWRGLPPGTQFSIDGLRHQNPILAWDTEAGWITFVIERNGLCEHCNFVHPYNARETKMGAVKVWCD